MSRPSSESHGNAGFSSVDQEVRAVNPCRGGTQPERTPESLRAERAWHTWRANTPKLAKARDELTRRLIVVWERLQTAHGNAYSVGAVARVCGVSEKIARQWRNGEKRVPLEAIAFFPGRLRTEALALLAELQRDMQRKAVGER